ncbi:unnamed protein product [Tilletia controversa]|uniref:Thioesterase-like superfamily-domain-containing protein n=3 Tax=Tilletia TaxID=13289 RepID=A0A8X7MQ96_9BASI|nr:hypothetical protein CF336_g4511 [Tilletia laevis]KAE8193706.1 hypothetical protein CF328_g4965 [Tilletia controversa]KAE8260295.1 hypothetical protein A4X03_0g3860 [Tilletia caries]KAE8201622.1 hypothetical protein CF335_g3699 [Tilletia laevis]KAE8244947.1 hypothetical protein A4X06_0g5892 [Tilletia controversa]
MSSKSEVPRLPADKPVYELLRIKKIDDLCDAGKQTWVYETALPGYTTFSRPAVFGGISLCVGLQAGSASLFEEMDEKDAAEFRPYSYQGSFLGPALPKFAIRITVTTIRSTRSFVTRLLTLSQPDPKDPDGSSKRRNTLVAICDFARRGRPALLEFDTPALNPVTGRPWERPSELPSLYDVLDEKKARAKAAGDQDELKRLMQEGQFNTLWYGFLDTKTPKDSLLAQTYWTTQNQLPTTQDNLPVTDRVLSDWFRFVPDLSDKGVAKISAERPDCVPFRPSTVHNAFFAFALDLVVPTTSLLLTKTPRRAAAPDFSLDFSIRFHREDGLDVNRWTLRQLKTLTAADGRTFNQVTLWDEDGRIIATVSQQGHLAPRPKRVEEASKAKL